MWGAWGRQKSTPESIRVRAPHKDYRPFSLRPWATVTDCKGSAHQQVSIFSSPDFSGEVVGLGKTSPECFPQSNKSYALAITLCAPGTRPPALHPLGPIHGWGCYFHILA